MKKLFLSIALLTLTLALFGGCEPVNPPEKTPFELHVNDTCGTTFVIVGTFENATDAEIVGKWHVFQNGKCEAQILNQGVVVQTLTDGNE